MSKDDVMSIKEAARKANVSVRVIYEWIKLGLVDIKVQKVAKGISLKQIVSLRDREKPHGGRPPGSKSS